MHLTQMYIGKVQLRSEEICLRSLITQECLHYPGVWKRGALQYVPTSIREMGHPTVIRAGDEVTFIINNDLSLYKPLN